MCDADFYQGAYPELLEVQNELRRFAETAGGLRAGGARNPVEHYKLRIKSSESMLDKLHRRGLSQTLDAALCQAHDAVGMRLVCSFLSDIYQAAETIRQTYRVVEEKDYIRNPKSNGYRSYHMILSFPAGEQGRTYEMQAEIQLRTIAMDCWASLEHEMKYKHDIAHQTLIVEELKRCAEELASADLRMQTIRELLAE